MGHTPIVGSFNKSTQEIINEELELAAKEVSVGIWFCSVY